MVLCISLIGSCCPLVLAVSLQGQKAEGQRRVKPKISDLVSETNF